MSLQVWLPLTGHLNNQGLSNVTVTNNGATVDNNGKIGKCYSFDGSSNKITISNLLNPKNISVAFWMKRNATTNTRQFMFTAWNGISLEMTVDNKIKGYVYNGAQCLSTNTITADSGWVHVVYTFKDKTEGKLYINGVLDNTASYSSSIQWNTTTGNIGNYSNMYYNGKINDFRIYDHALSAKEVKELSKGLVLHYPLSAGFGGAENLFRDSYFRADMILGGSSDTSTTLGYYNGAASNHSLANGEDTITLNGSSNIGINFKRLATDINLDVSSYYTISCEAKCTNASAHLDIGLSYCNTSNTWIWRGGTNPQNFTAANTWQKFTLTFKPDADTKYIGYCFTCNCGGNHTLVLRHCKLEKGSVATPWTMNILDTEMTDLATTEYDVSGYNNHGIKWSYNTAGSIETASETPRYNVCTFINSADSSSATPNGIQYIYGNFALTNPNYLTVAFWLKPLGGYQGQLGQGQFCFTNLDIGTGTCSDYLTTPMHNRDSMIDFCNASNTHKTVSFLPTSEWHHYAVIYDGRYGKIYKDGVYQASVDMESEAALASCKAIVIGFSKAGGVYRKNRSYFSDFRIYATALSAEDVKQLYNTAAALCNNGILMAYSFNET